MQPPRLRSLLVVLTLAACARRVPQPETPTAGAGATPPADPAPAFPPVPRVVGRLALRVVYPPAGALNSARDSTFLFGSTGSGEARLTINGVPVEVLPNGSWLAWLPLPPRERPVFELVAVQGSDTVRLAHPITLPGPRRVLPAEGTLAVDSGSVAPRGVQVRLPNDPVRVSVRAPRNAAVALVAGGVERPLHRLASLGSIAAPDPDLWATDVEARLLDGAARLVVTRGRDTVQLAAPRVALADSAGRRFAVVGDPAAAGLASDRVINGRPLPGAGGTYKWFLLRGTILELTGRSDNFARVRLDPLLDVWVDAAELRELPAGTPAPARVAGNARVVPGGNGEWSDVTIPMADRPAWSVDEGERELVLTLHGTTANTDIIHYAAGDSVVRHVRWEQLAQGRARFVVSLREQPFGYVARWERGAFVLRVRRAPRIDPARPLAGVTIAVDAGHPPGGSTGPTGLYEPVATLAIANRLRSLLESRGATVVMPRSSPAALGLAERPAFARQANAHAFVSIHLNALPDGVNPFRAHGTGTYYFNPSSVALAREVQAGMVQRMGLRDLGINYDNLAVIRPTWMPSILCEGAFLMLPEQEALLRMPEFQHAYALGVAEGLERYFRGLAR